MRTTRTRSGFFFAQGDNIHIWASYAGTNEDIMLTMKEEQIEAAARRFDAHKHTLKASYGMGILMNFNEQQNLWSLETVYNGRMLYLVFNGNVLSDMANTPIEQYQ
jgi:hypothetical protein